MHCGDFELLLHTFCAICIISNDINSISISHELVFIILEMKFLIWKVHLKGKGIMHIRN